jgi:hypothetical protein
MASPEELTAHQQPLILVERLLTTPLTMWVGEAPVRIQIS